MPKKNSKQDALTQSLENAINFVQGVKQKVLPNQKK